MAISVKMMLLFAVASYLLLEQTSGFSHARKFSREMDDHRQLHQWKLKRHKQEVYKSAPMKRARLWNEVPHICTRCGYMYFASQGVPRDQIPPRTSFSDLPSSWKCPICGSPKDTFYVASH